VTRAALAVAAALTLALPPSTAAVQDVTVFAASSLTAVFPRIDGGPRYSFAGSDTLALQIQNGAPADVFASASPAQPEALFRQELVLRPQVFARNRLTVVVPRANPGRVRTVLDLARPGVKLVIAEPKVPIGAYTRRALVRLGIARAALRNVVSLETDVRGVLAKVVLGQADAGIVYVTDARSAGERVRSVAVPRRAQPDVRYEIAVVAASGRREAAQAFVREVLGPRGRRALVAAGFGLP
jgi:molybdate transport system substrate-binding protein